MIEVQTGDLSSMKQKATSLLELGHRVRIVNPIPVEKWIVKVAADGTRLSRRRSLNVGKATDVFAELVSFPEYLVHARLEVDVHLTIEEEYRRNCTWASLAHGGEGSSSNAD